MRCLKAADGLPQSCIPDSMARFSIVLTTTDRPNLLAADVRAVLDMNFGDLEIDCFGQFLAYALCRDFG